MSDANPKVLALVERALKKNPELPSTELKERAIKVDASVAELSGRQFHAQYTLPVRRRMPGSGSGKSKRKAKPKAKGGRKRTRARQPKAAGRDSTSNTVLDLLRDDYRQRRAALEDAIDGAFQRAIASDSVNQVNDLLSWIDQQSESLK